MTNAVIKCSPEDDFYVLWSDNVEAPLAYGDREFIVDYLTRYPGAPLDVPEERVARADDAGTSYLWPPGEPPAYGWADPILIYKQQGVLRRHKLKELCERLHVDPTDRCQDLLEPFEDEEMNRA